MNVWHNGTIRLQWGTNVWHNVTIMLQWGTNVWHNGTIRLQWGMCGTMALSGYGGECILQRQREEDDAEIPMAQSGYSGVSLNTRIYKASDNSDQLRDYQLLQNGLRPADISNTDDNFDILGSDGDVTPCSLVL